jgi:cytochrome P450
MAQYPEIQAKARDEVDKVVGVGRLPTLSDQDQLPYVNAIISEIFRYCHIGPLGVSRQLRVDEDCTGYLMPKGSILIPNVQYVCLVLHDVLKALNAL